MSRSSNTRIISGFPASSGTPAKSCKSSLSTGGVRPAMRSNLRFIRSRSVLLSLLSFPGAESCRGGALPLPLAIVVPPPVLRPAPGGTELVG